MTFFVNPKTGAEIAAETESTLRTTWKTNIDNEAGAARERFVSPGALVDQEYQATVSDVAAWRAAGSPANAVPVAVTSWAQASGMTDEEAAANIEQTAALLNTVLMNIRAVRLAGKAAVDSALVADIETTAQTYIDQLRLIKP